jgi:hypothetical protein
MPAFQWRVTIEVKEKKTDLRSSVESARFLQAALVIKERAVIQQAQGFWFDVGVASSGKVTIPSISRPNLSCARRFL